MANSPLTGIKIGTLIGNPSAYKTIKTKSAIIYDAVPVEITKIDHFQYRSTQNPNYVYPLGEIFYFYNWYPAIDIRWSRTTSKYFKSYKICYRETNSSSKFTQITISDKNQTMKTVRLSEYDRDYEFKIILEDNVGNIVESRIRKYKTIKHNTAPELVGELRVNYADGEDRIYNKKPNSKYNLRVYLPLIKDNLYGSINSVPDVEQYRPAFYSNQEWIAMIGRYPVRLSIKKHKTERELWIVNGKIYNANNSESEYVLTKSENGNYFIDINGFDERTKFNFRFTAIDTTGHYTYKNFTFITEKSKPKTLPAPVKPYIKVENEKYYNGSIIKAGEVINVNSFQCFLKISITMESIDNLKMFNVYYKAEGEEEYTKNTFQIKDISGNNITKIANKTQYDIIIQSFLPSKKYKFKVDAENTEGSLSETSDNIEYTTSVGDKKPPMIPIMGRVRRFSDGTIYIPVKKPNEVQSSLLIFYTEDANIKHPYRYENKKIFNQNMIANAYRNLEFASFKLELDPNKDYRMALYWRDIAYNMSSVRLTNLFSKNNKSY